MAYLDKDELQILKNIFETMGDENWHKSHGIDYLQLGWLIERHEQKNATTNAKTAAYIAERRKTDKNYARGKKGAYILTYTNSKGKEITKSFCDEESAQEWTRKLDKRIERGTCGGYLLTEI